MKFSVGLVLTFSASCFCATVGEYPFFNDTDADENLTTATSISSSEFETEIGEVDTTTVQMNFSRKDSDFQEEPTAIFQILRNFLFQARDGLLDPLEQITQGPMDDKTEKMIRAIEHGLIEATTMLISQMENGALSTLPSNTVENSQKIVKRTGEIAEVAQERVDLNIASIKNKRQTAFDQVSNMSTSCSDCYDNLQSCVKQCFVHHNCNDIQRSARMCAPVPNRLCNPFTPWNPVDECQSNSDCNSPLLCCNDGCINKCTPGVWRS